jgi:hypothetical protein
MTTTQPELVKPPWVNHYYFIVPNATGTAILMLPSAEGWRLPYLRAEQLWLSETGRMISLLRAAFEIDFDFTILRYAAVELNNKERWDRVFFVIEPAQPLHHPSLGGQWVDSLALYHMQLALPGQKAALVRYLEENDPGAATARIDSRRAPWARPGWFATASAWIENAIVELGYEQSSPVQQLRNWSISSLLVVPTSAGRLYFKAAAALPLFVNEPALTQTLSELYPGHIPTPLKIDRDQRWMLMEDFGSTAWGDDRVDLAPILRAYSRLQRDSAEHIDKLRAAGCLDRQLSVLASQIDPLISNPITQAALTPQEYETLVALAPQLKARCATVAAYNIPPTLLHGDLHLGNITQRNGDYLFFDWTDASIGFPFLDLFLLYFRDDEGTDPTRGRDAYLEIWRDYETPARLLELWELAKPLCALHHAISYLTILSNIEPLARDELFHGLPNNLHRLLAAMSSHPC